MADTKINNARTTDSSINLMQIANDLKKLSSDTMGLNAIAKALNAMQSVNFDKKAVDKIKVITTDLATISDSIPSLNASLSKFTDKENGLGSLIKSLIDVSKIKVDTKSISNIKKIPSFLKIVSFSFQDIVKEFNKLVTDIDPEKIENIINILVSREISNNPEGLDNLMRTESGITKTYGKHKQHGLIETIQLVLGLSESLNNLKFAKNGMLFKLKFKRLLNVFSWSVDQLYALTQNKLNASVMEQMGTGVAGIQEVVATLPSITNNLFKIFDVGLLKGLKIKINSKDPKDNIFYKMVMVCREVLCELSITSKKYGSEIKEYQKLTKTYNRIIISMLHTYSAAAILAVPALIGYKLLFSKKIGVIYLMMHGLRVLARQTKKLQESLKSIALISVAIGALTLAVVAIAMTGVFIIKIRAAILINLIFIAGIVAVFGLLASKIFQDTINSGIKEIMLITLAVTLIALIALMVGVLGKYVTAEWESMLKVGMLMVVLCGVFISISMVSNRLNAGIKEMVGIALAVAILAGIALIIGVVGNYITAEWESIWKFTVLIAVLTGAVVGAGFLAQQLDKGIGAILALTIPIIAMVGATWALVELTNQVDDMNKLLEMAGIMVGIFAVFVGLGVLLGAVGQVALVGAGIMVALCVPILMMATSFTLIVSAMKNAIELSKDTSKEDITKVFDMLGGFVEMASNLGGSVVKMIKQAMKMMALTVIVSCVGNMVETIKDVADLKIATKFDENGRAVEWRHIEKEDYVNASLNCATIVSLFTALFDKNATSLPDGTKINPINMDGLAKINLRTLIKIAELKSIVACVGNMAETITEVANLKVATEFDKDGRAIKYTSMGADQFKTASDNVALIMTTLVSAVAGSAEVVENVKRRNIKKIKLAMESVQPITSIVESIKTLSEGSIPVYAMNGDVIELDENGSPKITGYKRLDTVLNDPKLQQNINSIFTTIISAIAKVANNGSVQSNLKTATKFIDKNAKVLEQMCNISSQIADVTVKFNGITINEKFNETMTSVGDIMNLYKNWINTPQGIDIYERQSNSTVKLLKQINSVDTSKLTQVSKLMESLAMFSKSINGNFDRLATTINKKLLTVIIELNKNLKELKDFNIGSASSSSVSTPSQTVIPQGFDPDKNVKSNGKVDYSHVETAHNGDFQDELDEIIRLLKIVAKDKF